MKNKSRFWPAWYYGPKGASDIFNSPSEVPEGWQTHPSKVKAGKDTVHPGGEEASQGGGEDEDEDEDDVGEEEGEEEPAEPLPAYDDITKEDIVARLEATDGLTFNKAWNKERLYEVLKDTL